MLEDFARTSAQILLKSPAEMCMILSSVLDRINHLTSGLVCSSKQLQETSFGQIDHLLVTLLSGLEVNPGWAKAFAWKCIVMIIKGDGGLTNVR